jgi:predicted DNA-binding protein
MGKSSLTETQYSALQDISRLTGRTEAELLREAVDHFIAQFQKEDRRTLMRAARGIWKCPQDLPSLRELRNELDRTLAIRYYFAAELISS